jgi:ubiquinone/menaquinone biosynthesis C-methylase UbiE
MSNIEPPASVPTDAAIDADAFNAFEAAGWEHQAPTYDQFFGRITGRLVNPLLDAADVGPRSRVLDLATGPGYAAAAATERGASVVGVDFAPGMVELARHIHPDIEFRQADGEALPFEDGSFDAAVSNFVVPHLGRPERVVRELVRVLRRGGSLALTTWDQPERMRVLGVFLDAFAEAGATPPADLPVGPPFFRFAADEQFAALLADNGLTDVRVRTIAIDHRVASAEELWNGMLTSTVRTSAFFLGQPEDTRRRIRAVFDRRILEHRRGDEFELPVSVKLAHGHTAR